MNDGKRVGGRDGGIDGIAAGLQDLDPDLRGESLLGDHHAVSPLDRSRRGGDGGDRGDEERGNGRTAARE